MRQQDATKPTCLPDHGSLAWLRLPSVPAARFRAAISRIVQGAGPRTAGRRANGQSSALVLASVLPMEPQSSRLRGQWFEGWFIRLVDHDNAASVSIIFGSLRRRVRSESPFSALGPFDEHLIALGYSDGRDGTERMHQVLLDGSTVQLSGGRSGSNARSSRPACGPSCSSHVRDLFGE